MTKVVYVAKFENGAQYVGFCDADCRRLKPNVEGRVGFAGRLKTKFEEQNRCWHYTAPVYVLARTESFTAEIFGRVNSVDAARKMKRDLAKALKESGVNVING